jgi:hypothetical protein
MQVKDLTTDELKALIQETVIEALAELFPDPDEDKVLKEDFKQKLLAIRQRRQAGSRGVSPAEAMNILGLSD